MSQAREEVEQILGRPVEVEQTIHGAWICQFVDYQNPKPTKLVGDTEEIAYQKLLEYLKSRPTELT